MGKYTRGPWVKNRYGELKSPAGENINVWGLGVTHSSRTEESEANAILLEAAPCVVKALIDLKIEVVLSDIPYEHIEKLQPYLNAANEALRRAGVK